MNWLDLTLAAILAVSVAVGVAEGFSKSGFGLLAVTCAFLCAAWSQPADARGFLLVFGISLGILAAMAGVLGSFFHKAELRWLDGLLGGAMGLANGALFCVGTAVVLLAYTPALVRHQMETSHLAPCAIEAARVAAEAAPASLKARVESSYEELRSKLPPRFRDHTPESLHGDPI